MDPGDPTSECIDAVSRRCAEEGLDEIACDEALRAACFPAEEIDECAGDDNHVCAFDPESGGPLSYGNHCEADRAGAEVLADLPCEISIGDPVCPEGYVQTDEICDSELFEAGTPCHTTCTLEILALGEDHGTEQGSI